MIGIDVAFEVDEQFADLAKQADDICRDNVRHTAARVRRTAQGSIRISPTASAPGEPAHSRRGDLVRAVAFAAGEEEAIVGPMKSVIGESGAAHELGGEFRGHEFEPRPVMVPAMIQQTDFFADSFHDTFGE